MNGGFVLAGDLIAPKDDRHKCGSFTHIVAGEIRANVMGHVKSTNSAGGVLLDVVPLKSPGIVPYAGAVVLAKHNLRIPVDGQTAVRCWRYARLDGVESGEVASLSRRVVRCDIVTVDDKPLAGPFRGIIRREDIRATQRDQAEPAECYRPGDLIRARVINLIGPGAVSTPVTLSGSNISSQTAATLLAARAVSASVGATADASSGTLSNAVCLLSTAEPDLGVVLGLGRSPNAPLVDLLGSTSGCPLVPVAWTEMLCPHTLARFPRKVARVPDELLNQLVQIDQ